MRHWLLLSCLSTAAQAGGLTETCAAFDACIVEIMTEEADNFMAPILVPVICGVDHHPMQQSCGTLAYLVRPADCWGQDLANWSAQSELAETAALSMGLPGRGSLFEQGLERCETENQTEFAKDACETETHWRETIVYLGNQVWRAHEESQP